jgi:hypothetical protein
MQGLTHFPGEDLWIFEQGRIVEDNHGTLDDLCAALCSAGFLVTSKLVIRSIPGTRVDIAFLTLRRLALAP